MNLYEKHVSPNGKVTYKEHTISRRVDVEIDDLQINALVSTIAICWLHAMSKQLSDTKKGSALATRIKAVEEAVTKMAKLASGKIDEKMVDAGTIAWGAALQRLQLELSKCEA